MERRGIDKAPLSSDRGAVGGYRETYEGYDRESNERQLFGSAGIRNAAELCCDDHLGKNRVALRWRSHDGRSAEYTFEDLSDRSRRFASVLAAAGVGRGDRVACLLPRIPELLMTALGVWRLGALYQPLFTAFGPSAIEHRLRLSEAKVIVTDALNRAKLTDIDVGVRIVVVSPDGSVGQDGDLDFHREVEQAEPIPSVVPLVPDDPFLIMFTSGTTGPAKPLLVPLKAILGFANYAIEAVDVRRDDRFWNIADPGWGYGLYFGVIGPLALGHTILFYDGPFTVDSTSATIRDYGITNLAGSPTAFRHIAAAGPEAVEAVKGQLRAVSSAGEPLNPDVISWFANHLGVVVHDHYGQTEAGMVVNNHHGLSHPVHLGSAGYASPGYRVVILGDDGSELPPGQQGQMAIDREGSPLFWFTGYIGSAPLTEGQRYYLSGDMAEFNDDGSISFVGRADDVITSSGYRIGPYDVESALVEHRGVLEAGVVGKPDPQRTEIVKAFVVLNPGFEPDAALAHELQQHVRNRLSAHAYPREIAFVKELPKTQSGKIQRFLLRSLDAGLQSG